jgi:hypothetical protein
MATPRARWRYGGYPGQPPPAPVIIWATFWEREAQVRIIMIQADKILQDAERLAEFVRKQLG